MQSSVSPADDLFDHVDESVIVRGLDGKIRFWNSASEETYGWRRAEVIGRPADGLFGDDDGEKSGEHRKTVLETGAWRGNAWRGTAGNEKRLIAVRWLLRRDAAGNPVDIVETGRDVTESHVAQEELHKSEHRYRNLFQAMAASFWELDFFPVGQMLRERRKAGVIESYGEYFRTNPDFVREMMRLTRVVDVNDQTVALFGRGDKQELLTTVEPFWPEASTDVYGASVAASISGELNFSAETRLRRIDGTEFDALFTACFPPDTMHKGTLLVGVIDITERNRAFAELERSESRYRNLFHQMPVALWQMDSTRLVSVLTSLRESGITDLSAYLDHNPLVLGELMDLTRVAEVNRRAVELFGGKQASDLVVSSRRYWISKPETFRRILEARWRGDTVFEEETQMNALDGSAIDGLFTIAFPPALDAIGISLNAFVDMTVQNESLAALKESEARFQRMQAEFAHAARVSTLGEMAASIAHEVNQPLAAISANGSAGLRWLARDEPDIAEVEALTGRIVADARRAADIIGRIRAMASGGAPEMTAVSIYAVAEDAAKFLSHEMHKHDVRLALDVTPACVMADRIQIQQVLVNLAMNAIQAMAAAPVAERVLTLRSCIEGSRVIVSVEDTGNGIAPDDLPRLFDSFFTRREGGMGLGLAIARSIVGSFSGSIRAENCQSGGARFIVDLPVHTPGEETHTKV